MQGGEEVARIGLRAEEGCAHLSYWVRVREGEWQDVEELVWLIWRPGRFGGCRPMVSCGASRWGFSPASARQPLEFPPLSRAAPVKKERGKNFLWLGKVPGRALPQMGHP